MSEQQSAEKEQCACPPDECRDAGSSGCYFGAAALVHVHGYCKSLSWCADCAATSIPPGAQS